MGKHKCKHCGNRSLDARKVGLSYFCDNDFKCASEWSKNEAKKKQDKLRKTAARKDAAEQKEERRKHREDKERIKPTAKLITEAQAAVNLYRRLAQYYDPCCSCNASRDEVEREQGWKVGGAWDAGHYRSRGAAGQLRFILCNINKQCKSCNAGEKRNAGKAESVKSGYDAYMTRKYGEERRQWLLNNNEPDLHKSDRERLQRIKTIFRRRARYYQKLIDIGVKYDQKNE